MTDVKLAEEAMENIMLPVMLSTHQHINIHTYPGTVESAISD